MSIEEIIAKAQEQYEKTIDIKADFVQEVSIKSMNKTDREAGIFYFKNPRRMIWDYLKPKPKKLIINTQTAWFYIPEDRIVYVQDAESIFKNKAGIRFLSGLGNLNKDFHITFSGPENIDKEGNLLLKLVPKESGFGIEEFFLTLDKDQFYVTRLSFTDGFGNTTRLLFRNIKLNNNFADKLFSFSPPPGVEVYKAR
ncbi:MAG: outer membrane lipoprotein carrier protein LolA [Syntrophales bacterium LBB04]|nr:outer membrane lipoprotein carrier protein LolA [Syntrophales bacterium LBB04]